MSEIRINIRTTEAIKAGVKKLAKHRGMGVTSLVNSLIVEEVRKENLQRKQFAAIKAQAEAVTA